ncbi:GNAT family N-acetyltransferase [Streptomyces tsukubensis]|uniref:GNAT family N-acetyltransferase n=1 Tax=Streptomyces tsukubensis TaxID=83656 RepID=A0A1V4A1U7_9ACTN|nr:GNAT family N-acetyltransferase [Streptomyces tsukubensis]OON72948.1 GNAT family N-acetyltransferase [Streptomyces tsukubensis]QFR94449.1 GNAT family N-acetyltransferase [Streptomyces tsukubensis]
MAGVPVRVEILRAGDEHVEQIALLAESRSLNGPEGSQRQVENGFLVSAYAEADYRARLDSAEHFYVAVKGGQVLAFLLAYSSDQVEPDEWLNRRIKTALGSFLVIKQICVAQEAARSGIASMLYYHILDQWDESPVIAAVVNDPPNHASARFHQKLGFQELTRMVPPDGLPRVVWVWRKPREAMLHSQYQIAVDLYKHEDSLNWQKLNNFFYITAGLAAAIAFVLGKEGADGPLGKGLAIIIAIIGIGASLGFSLMLRFGRQYLLARKEAVIELEEYMAWHGGERIVNRRTDAPGSAHLKVSPTGAIMVLLPVLVSLCWLAILGVMIAN